MLLLSLRPESPQRTWCVEASNTRLGTTSIRRSLIVTSNKPFSASGEIVGDDMAATAMVHLRDDARLDTTQGVNSQPAPTGVNFDRRQRVRIRRELTTAIS